MLEKLFKLKEHGTDVKTEVVAGLTTFMTMAYIIALNPNILTNYAVGSELWNAVFLATCIASGFGTILMAILANKPFAMAPGMGLNAFFVYTVCFGLGFSYANALLFVLADGIIFIILTASIQPYTIDCINLPLDNNFPTRA